MYNSRDLIKYKPALLFINWFLDKLAQDWTNTCLDFVSRREFDAIQEFIEFLDFPLTYYCSFQENFTTFDIFSDFFFACVIIKAECVLI